MIAYIQILIQLPAKKNRLIYKQINDDDDDDERRKTSLFSLSLSQDGKTYFEEGRSLSFDTTTTKIEIYKIIFFSIFFFFIKRKLRNQRHHRLLSIVVSDNLFETIYGDLEQTLRSSLCSIFH